MGVDVLVGVGNGVGVSLGVGVSDGVSVGVGVAVGAKVGVAVGVGVEVPSIGGWVVIGDPPIVSSTTRPMTRARAATLASLVFTRSSDIRVPLSSSHTMVYIAGSPHNVHHVGIAS